MRKYVTGKGTFLKGGFFASVVLLMALAFHACQQEEVLFDTQEPPDASAAILNSGLNPEIDLEFPEKVTAGEDFEIAFSSTCGRIMLERGYIEEVDADGITINKLYTGLTCDTENLLWEAVWDDVYETCLGKTITQNLANPGTYVYRAKLNFKAVRGSECPDCEDFLGNKFECIMITAVESSMETFTDPRDGKVYKIITFGNQTWMAENLAYNMDASGGSKVYGDLATNGRLYSWTAAVGQAAPEGWHLPTVDEWNALIYYLTVNGFGYGGSGDDIAKSLASTAGWESSPSPGTPGNEPVKNNGSGFNGPPAGMHEGIFWDLGRLAYWWTATEYSAALGNVKSIGWGDSYVNQLAVLKFNFYSVRCVKDTE